MRRASFNDGWQYREKVNPFAELAGAVTPYAAVRLPHDAMIGRDRSPRLDPATAYFPGGVCQYRKAFTRPEYPDGGRAIVQFEGVYRDAMVYLNGALAASHAYGYTAFTADLTSLLLPGENTLLVESRSHQDSRWYSGAGIYRPAWLWTGGPVRVALDGVTITTPDIDAGRAIAEVAVTIESDSLVLRTVMARVRVTGPDGDLAAAGEVPVTIRPHSSATARQRLVIEAPARWGPDSPRLYAAEVQLCERAGAAASHAVAGTAAGGGEGAVIDQARATFGIRRLQVDPRRGLRVNGEPVKLRGACVHHDSGILGAATFPAAEDRRVRLLKAAGFNAIRSAHNPASPALLAACDRHGMLVIDEAFDMWAAGKNGFDYSLDFPAHWERDIEAMVAKDRNHPCVIMYSIGNEVIEAGTPAGAATGRDLAEKVRSLDQGRLVTNGVNGMLAAMDDVRAQLAEHRNAVAQDAGVNTMMNQVGELLARVAAMPAVTDRTAESFGVLDVAGMNYLQGRYELDRDLFPNRVIVGTETAPPEIDRLWRLVLDNPHVLGDFTWAGWDYLGEVGVGRVQYPAAAEPLAFEAPYPWIAAWTGDLDITGTRRPASYYRQIVFGLRATPYIAVQRPQHHGEAAVLGQWSWSDSVASWTWPGFAGKPVVVEVYSAADEVELLLNGQCAGRAPAGEAHRFKAAFDLSYQPGTLTAIAYRDGREESRTTLATATGPLTLTATADRDELPADGGDVALVEITLADAHGTVPACADRLLVATVTGAGELVALGSGRPRTQEGYQAGAHTTFQGRALAAVRATGPGDLKLEVSSADGLSAAITLTARPVATGGGGHRG
jgi:beta-galactosidase